MTTPALPKEERGVTLLSLMIAMAIGLFLVGAVIKIYLDTKNSFNMRNAVAEVAENQRFALDDMRRILVMAGREIRAIEDQFNDRRPFADVVSGGIVDGGSSGSDTIAIRYRRGPGCGTYRNDPLTGPPTMVRFYVNNSNELICETTPPGGSPTDEVLATGIVMLKVLYGVDDDQDGFANRYLSASQIRDPGSNPSGVVTKPPGKTQEWSPWAKVVSVRIALLAGSQQELPKPYRKSTPPEFSLLGLKRTAPDGSHLYRVATTTVALRNLHPTIQRQ